MLDILLDALLDGLKTLPFLFGAYLLMEFLEHRGGEKFSAALGKMGTWGPLGGAVLGCVPQCGFSVAAANFYAGRIISPGTLVAVFLSTSDEALPILISNPESTADIFKLLGVKLVSALIFGLLTDLICRRVIKLKKEKPFEEICADCGCEEHGIFRSALKHTVKVFCFLLIVNIVLGFAIYFVGEDAISRFMLSGSVFQPLLTALIGFIPNCAASVILTELYLQGSLSFGSAVAGLCTGAGLGMAVLFRTNRHIKENLCLTAAIYAFAVITGVICGFIFPE